MRHWGKATIVAAGLLVSSFLPAWAEKITITDIVGRDVEVNIPVSSVILGEGRMIYIQAILDKDAPFKRVIGWRDDLPKTDPEIYAAYLEKYPQIADLPLFGRMGDNSFSIEQAIALKPDVIVMDIDAVTAAKEGGYIESLEKADIPLIYVDFRVKAMENTEQSLRIMGKLMGKEEVAEELIKFRADAIKQVTDRLEQTNPERPVVFIERAPGFSDECCGTFGNENFGKMIEFAGGHNMAKELVSGTFGMVNPEQVIASDPAHVIITGSNWIAYAPEGDWVGVGHGADKQQAKDKLKKLMQRPAFTDIRAVKDNNVHAAWHQFYVNPYQFVVIQQMAKWFHPELFADLDPDATFAELYERFLPIEYKSGYFVSLSDAQ